VSLSSSSLQQILASNVIELVFVRRTPRKNKPPTRRMLATLNFNLLNSARGKNTFKFNPPSFPADFNASSYNLVTAFDLFMLDWRNIPANATEIVRVIPCSPEEEFWLYFDTVLSKLSAAQKAAFMDK
jgi:hypothetical protein